MTHLAEHRAHAPKLHLLVGTMGQIRDIEDGRDVGRRAIGMRKWCRDTRLLVTERHVRLAGPRLRGGLSHNGRDAGAVPGRRGGTRG